MHTVVRVYEGAQPLFDQLAKSEDQVRELITTVPGFLSYTLVRTDDGGISVTSCEDRTGTDESNRRAAEWITANVPATNRVEPEIIEGDAMYRFVSRQAAERALQEQKSGTAIKA